MSGALIRFPRRVTWPRDGRAETLRIRANHHSLVVEMIDVELRLRVAGYVEEAAEIAPQVEGAASSLREFERRVAAAELVL